MEIPIIDGFEILEKLGEGGMASVWKARQISLNRLVAIKILAPHLAAAAEDVNRFLKEACSTAQLKHPGIVQVYDAKATEDLYYFVMEYVAGYTVGDWVRRKGCLSENNTLLVIDCIADAMDYAWNTARVVHCDIKPDNIIIDADGTVKVADLGLSHTINAINIGAEHDEIMGTPAYISPEQAEGKADLDCRSDIYSLGAMMYHMLTGKLMFQGASDDQVLQMQVGNEPIDAQKLNPSISDSVNKLLKQMLRKKRSARPQDWAQVRGSLFQVRDELYGEHGAIYASVAVTGGLTPFEQRDSKYRSEKIKNLLILRAVLSIVGVAVAVLIVTKIFTPNNMGQNIDAAPIAIAIGDDLNQPSDSGAGGAVSTTVDDNAREMFEFAQARQKDSDNIQESIQAFRKVSIQTRGTKYSLMAEDEVKLLQKKLKDQISTVMLQLDDKAKAHVDAEKLLEAANIYESYDGYRKLETRDFRQDAARLLRVQHTQKSKDIQLLQKRNRKLIKELINTLPEVILSEGVNAANTLLQNAINNPALEMYLDKLNVYSEMLTQAENINQYILDSFREQIGKEVVVSTGQGRLTLVITAVDDYRIVGRQDINVGSGIASSEVVFSISDLTPREKILRMGSDDISSVALVKGIMAYQSEAYSHARRFFETVGEPLSSGLLAQIDKQIKDTVEQEACDNLRIVLSCVGIDVPAEFDVLIWKNILGSVTVDSEDVDRVARAIEVYMSEYGNTDFAVSASPLLDELKWITGDKGKSLRRSSLVTEEKIR